MNTVIVKGSKISSGSASNTQKIVVEPLRLNKQ